MISTVVQLLVLHAISSASLPNSRPMGFARKLDYCSLCESPGTHTMCLYPAGPDSNCKGYRSSPLTDAEKRTIVRTHNVVRSRVANGLSQMHQSQFGAQPKAANMHQMYWDEELAAIAQRWADRCLSFYTHTPHDECRDTFRFPVGQNIVTTAFSQPVASDIRARCLDWYGEVMYYDPEWTEKFAPNPDPDPAKQTGHYTQMVWGWSYAIGCARVVFTEKLKRDEDPWTIERLVCNYAPSGNYLGENVYKIGEPCSQCSNGTVCSKRYPGLCSARIESEDRTNKEKTTVSSQTTTAPSEISIKKDSLSDMYKFASFLPLAWTNIAVSSADSSERIAEESAILADIEALENGTKKSESFTLAYAEPSVETFSNIEEDELDLEDEADAESLSMQQSDESTSSPLDSTSQMWGYSSAPTGSKESGSTPNQQDSSSGLHYYAYRFQHASF